MSRPRTRSSAQKAWTGTQWRSFSIPIPMPWLNACRPASTPPGRPDTRRSPAPNSCARGSSRPTRPPRARLELPLGVAGPSADHALPAAEFVAFARRLVQRTRNPRPDRIAVRPARVGHVDGKRGAGALHGDCLAIAALALPERRGARRALGGIVVSLAIGAAFADRERTGRPRLGRETAGGHRHRQNKNEQRIALRRPRNAQNPLPRGEGHNLTEGAFQLVNVRLHIEQKRRRPPTL